MKKFLLLTAVVMLGTMPSFAILTTDEVVSEEYIKHHGHSTELARLIKLQQCQINNEPIESTFKYAPNRWYEKIHWSKKATRDETTKNVLRHLDPKKPEGKYVRTIYNYLDPGQDDGLFMQNDTEFTNSYEDL